MFHAVSRLKLGILIPSTNTVAEPEYHRLLPAGVTAHAGRLLVTRKEIGTDASYLHLTEQMLDALEPTTRNLVTCQPGRIALCMAAASFVGGVAGDETVRARLEAIAGVPATTAPAAFLAALRAYDARRIVVVSPFQPHLEKEAVRFFEEGGVEVVGTTSFLSQSTTAIAKVAPDQLRAALAGSDRDDADAIVQLGTNVHMAAGAASAEWWLGKPVLHVNTVMAWHALRAEGIDDRVEGFGSLLSEH